ncbi:universal stress protein [Ornithinimicrobium tianjinense]|uniref:Universal stress protein n=1 Tax=Ornithinimicrobium tianjinense TaxID=1195761 RepID=A0A917F3P9_9MICO|nr:universal stress protein [Ornithinimicrobium tianjinense]GGF39686.1 universal stress protein [Ornithinimicrobium tianjinense]
MSYSTILVPVVPDHVDEGRKAIETARQLLDPGGRITVIAVHEDPPYYMPTDAYWAVPAVLERQETLGTELQDALGSPDVEVLVRRGQPTRVILDLAQEGGYGCIVMPSSQPGWRHTFLGSTASGVVRHAHCSVLVLREAIAG